MRRVFIIRKDLNMKPGKLAAMVGHCCEAYWTNLLKSCSRDDSTIAEYEPEFKIVKVEIPYKIWDEYVNGIFTKTICECKNLNQLLAKTRPIIDELKLINGIDYGLINDKCLTDLTPENSDGTCTIGMWFRPMKDEDALKISKKFKLYGAFDK